MRFAIVIICKSLSFPVQARELIAQEGSLAAFIWRYKLDPQQLAALQTVFMLAETVTLSKDLKELG